MESKFKINGKVINTTRGITCFFNKNGYSDVIIENYHLGSKLLNVHPIIDEYVFIKILYLVRDGIITTNKLKQHLLDIGDTFDYSRYILWLKFLKENKFESQSLIFNQLKFGEIKGLNQFNKIADRITPYKVKYWVNKGFSEDEALKEIKNYKDKKATSKNNFIKRYGKSEGIKKFEKFQETSKHTLNKFKKKYGEKVGKVKWDEYLKTKDSNSYQWALKKTGNVEKANDLIKLRRDSVKTTIEKLIKKLGCEDLAIKEYIRIAKSKTTKIGRASLESLKIFNDSYEYLLSIGYNSDDIKIGVKNNHELTLYSKKFKRVYLYDFAIKSKKVIIEYNGERWHPNYKKYSIEWLNENWKHIKSKKPAEYFIKREKEKITNAEEHGYKVLVLWSSDGIEENKNKVNNFLKINKVYES
jgi:very-short-patch-repair endonuclease